MTNTTTVYTEKKEERYIILFLTGLALYCIGYLLRRIGEETDIIRQPLQYLGFLILIIAAYKSISFRRNHYSTYIQYSMYALLLWHIYTILHNFSITSESLMTYFQPYFFSHRIFPDRQVGTLFHSMGTYMHSVFFHIWYSFYSSFIQKPIFH